MHPGGWCATLAVLGTLAAATAPHGDSGTSEELRQALVLIDILRSGMARRKTTTSPAAPTPTPAASPASLAPWLGPHAAYLAPYYPYEAPFRRFYDVNDPATSVPVTGTPPEDRPRTSTSAASEHSAVDTSAVAAPAAPTAPTAPSAAPHRALAPADIVSSTPRALHHPLPPSSFPAATEDEHPTRVSDGNRERTRQSEEHIEVSQAAAELRREATAGGARPPRRYRGTTRERRAHPPRRPSSSTREHLAHPPWRPRGSTRVHLARSSAPPRPLPENNAFCHASPGSPLCRTFI